MKAKLATAISVIGVLGAGSAAAMVNTQILDSDPTESGASKAVLPPASTVELSVPSVTDPIRIESLQVEVAPDATTTSTTSTTTTSTSTTTIAVPQPSGLLTSFNVGEAGVVTVDVVDGQLVLVSAEAKAGWTVTKAEDDSNDDSDEQQNEVDVEFVSATVRVEFNADYVDGRIVPHVESTSIGANSGGGTSASPAPTVSNSSHESSADHEDDDHEDHEDEDHEDHEDEDHEDEPEHHDGERDDD
jgi:hypothetical protein